MKLILILISLLGIISFTFQQSSKECWSLENPSSKEQCTNIKLSDSECCYIETNSDSNVEKECDSYNLNKINVDLYIKRELKLKKFSVITDYLEELNDIESLDDNGVINQLKKNLNFNVKVECKSLSKTLDYSTITYTKEDVQIAKKDNFYGKLLGKSDLPESECLNAIVFPDLEKAGEKCCYTEINYIYKYSFSNRRRCLTLSKEEREDFSFLEYLFNELAYGPFKATITCDGFNYEYYSSTDKWKEIDLSEQKCNEINNPSKETCNKLDLLNSECCFEKIVNSEEETSKYCKLYDPKHINYEGFEADQIKDIKIYYLGSTLANNFKDFSVDDETIIKYIEGQLAESASVECKTFSKAVNYSSVKYTKEDIEIGKKDNFCGQLMAKEEEVTEEECLNGVVFTDLAKAGEKCCYAEIELKSFEYKFGKCVSLSQAQRDNIHYLKSIAPENPAGVPQIAKVVCDGFNKQLSYIDGEWLTEEEEKDSYNMQRINLYLLILSLILLN